MATSSVISNKFNITRGLVGLLENAKVSVGKLYLRQMRGANPPPDANQQPGTNVPGVIEPNPTTGLGKNGGSNWAIYDDTGSQANLVANGQGMYTYAGNWNNWFTLVFKVERFKDSTLQVMGASAPDDKETEWAIVGGTGEFTMARGTIRRRVYSIIGDTITQELTMEFFCRMKEVVVPAPTKRGPWGANRGTLREMDGKSQRLESVTISHLGTVQMIEFSYIDENRRIRTAGAWGRTNQTYKPKKETIKFDPSEVVKRITGAVAIAKPNTLSKFEIITNHKTYGPFGYHDGATPFSYTVPENETVVGFFAKTGDDEVTMIGVYTI